MRLRLKTFFKGLQKVGVGTQQEEFRIESEWDGIVLANYLGSKYNMRGSWSNLPTQSNDDIYS